MTFADLIPAETTQANATKTYVDSAISSIDIPAGVPRELSWYTNDSGYLKLVNNKLTVPELVTPVHNVTSLVATSFETVAVNGISKVSSSDNIVLSAAEGAGIVKLEANKLQFNDSSVQGTAGLHIIDRTAPVSGVAAPTDVRSSCVVSGDWLYVCLNNPATGIAYWKKAALQNV